MSSHESCVRGDSLRETAQMGTTAIGIRTKEGVVLAVEKRLTSPLLEPGRYVQPRSCVDVVVVSRLGLW